MLEVLDQEVNFGGARFGILQFLVSVFAISRKFLNFPCRNSPVKLFVVRQLFSGFHHFFWGEFEVLHQEVICSSARFGFSKISFQGFRYFPALPLSKFTFVACFFLRVIFFWLYTIFLTLSRKFLNFSFKIHLRSHIFSWTSFWFITIFFRGKFEVLNQEVNFPGAQLGFLQYFQGFRTYPLEIHL